MPCEQAMFEAIDEAEAAALAGGGLEYGIVGPPFSPIPFAFASYSQGSSFVNVGATFLPPFTGLSVEVKYSTRVRSGGFTFVVPSSLRRG